MSEYISTMRDQVLPPAVSAKARQHLLDTVASIVSGSSLLAGKKAAEYVRIHRARSEAGVIGTRLSTSVPNAALANGMSAHADETDDSHPLSRGHPGCAVVPTALAVAEHRGSTGDELLRAIVAGYDVGARVSLALRMRDIRAASRNTVASHSLVGIFGAATAAMVLEELDEQKIRYALSYAAQLASGVTAWMRDGRHVQKAFVFAGMPAHNGAIAVQLASAGLDGVEDVFAGEPNFLDAWSPNPDRGQLSEELGERYEVMRTNIKKYSVGSPAQPAVQAAEDLLSQYNVQINEIRRIEIRVPAEVSYVVDSRSMPDINIQYLVAGTLIDGGFSFNMAHNEERLRSDPEVQALIANTTLIGDKEMGPTRQAIVTLDTDNGSLRQHVPHVRGTTADPMTTAEVETKATEIMSPVIGAERATELIEVIRRIESVNNVKHLRELLEA